jgi:ATP-dependent Lhr-like helicase
MTLSKSVGGAFYGNFSSLRSAQAQAIDPILAGQDVLVLAGTGSGKTEAVVAPVIDRYRSQAGARILYLTPTRALANDLFRRLDGPLEQLGLQVGIRHGERNDLARKEAPFLVITTPESLDVMLMQREPALRQVQAVVVDEIHLLYNTQRGLQTGILIARLADFAARELQVIGLSATVAGPDDIWRFLRPGHTPHTVRDETAKPVDYATVTIQSETDLVPVIDMLGREQPRKILVFTNSRRECDRLGSVLRGRTVYGNDILTHHSSVDGAIRVSSERRFLESRAAVCVATSTLELGVDIGDIDLVMLYGHPGGWQSFLQRAGRGNRRRDTTNVVGIVSPDHGPTLFLQLAFEALIAQVRSGRLEREAPVDLFGAGVQQILSGLMADQASYIRTSDLVQPLSGWGHLGPEATGAIIGHLLDTGYLRPHGFLDRVGAGDDLHRLRDMRMLWGNYPARSQEVAIITRGRALGSVPAVNLLRVRRGAIIRFAGRAWQVEQTNPRQIEVLPTQREGGIDVTYSGPGADLDPTLLEEILNLIEHRVAPVGMSGEQADRFLSATGRLQACVRTDTLPVVRLVDGSVLHFTFAGRLMNSVIARWAGLDTFHAGEVVLRCGRELDLTVLPPAVEGLREIAADYLSRPLTLTVFQQLLPPDLLSRELTDIWQKAPVYARHLQRLREATPIAADPQLLSRLAS